MKSGRPLSVNPVCRKAGATDAIRLTNRGEPYSVKAMIKFLHTRIRVSDLKHSIEFYEKLGFELVRTTDKSPAGNQLAFLEIPGNESFLELCYSPDYKVEVPEDLMHTALGYPDLIAKCDELEKQGIEIWPSGWREKFPTGSKMAFVTDPDGYEVELLERK